MSERGSRNLATDSLTPRYLYLAYNSMHIFIFMSANSSVVVLDIHCPEELVQIDLQEIYMKIIKDNALWTRLLSTSEQCGCSLMLIKISDSCSVGC